MGVTTLCGIGGLCIKSSVEMDVQPVVERMLVRQAHRGPDATGRWLSPDKRVALCHNRLAILDLSPAGAQPMANQDGSLIIAFNGEIYNWQALRQQFVAAGRPFRSATDTEVLLAAYEKWGEAMLSHLHGMFAFALCDIKRGILFCACDRIGKKPFVYAETPTGFVFASEIPAVLAMGDCDRSLDHDALAGMLLHNVRHIVTPHTAYRGLKRLRPGHALVARDGCVERIWRYWTPAADAGPATPERLREKLEEAVRLRMVADVPVGALLSGGVDSSAIVAMMQRRSADPVRTYALGFDAADEDLRRARLMAARLGCVHKEFYFDAESQWDIFGKLMAAHGEPIMLLPLLHTYALCEVIRADGIKVVLSGHGADELFYGYTGHVRMARLSQLLAVLGPLARAGEIVARRRPSALLSILAAPPGKRKAAFYRYCQARDWRTVLQPEARARLGNVVADELAFWGALCPRNAFIDESNYCALLVENTHSLTTSADLPPMRASVEMRAPFLDQDIIAFAMGTPVRKKVPWFAAANRLKWILRQAVRDLVPHELLFAPKRGFGFGISQNELLRGPWAGFGDALFAAPHDGDGLFDVSALRNAWELFKRSGDNTSNVIPKMFAIQYWLQSKGSA